MGPEGGAGGRLQALQSARADLENSRERASPTDLCLLCLLAPSPSCWDLSGEEPEEHSWFVRPAKLCQRSAVCRGIVGDGDN